MKKLLVTLIVLATVFTLGEHVDAYPVTYNIHTNVTDFNTYVTRCNDADCSSLDENAPYTFFDNSADNAEGFKDFALFKIRDVVGLQHSAEYEYAACYMPQAFIITTTDSTPDGPHERTRDFAKKSACTSPIKNISAKQTSNGIEVLVEVDSAFQRGGIPANMEIPDFAEDHYSSKVEVVLSVINQTTGVVVHSESKSQEIFMGSSEKVPFTWTDGTNATYQMRATATVIDCACSTQTPQTLDKNVSVAKQESSQPGAQSDDDDDDNDGTSGGTSDGTSGTGGTGSQSNGETAITADQDRIKVRPGTTADVVLRVHNGEDQTKTFIVGIENENGFSAQRQTFDLRSGITRTITLPVNIGNPTQGDHEMILFARANGDIVRDTVIVMVDWSIDFSVNSRVEETRDRVVVEYSLINRENVARTGTIMVEDRNRTTEKHVTVGANSFVSGEMEYPIDYSGEHNATVSFRMGNVTTNEESISFQAEDRGLGLGTTGLFVVGGTVAGGLVVLLIILAVFAAYEKNKTSVKKKKKTTTTKGDADDIKSFFSRR